MNEQQLINQWIGAQKEPLIQCQNKKGDSYIVDIENHKIYTLEEVKEWAKQTQNIIAR